MADNVTLDCDGFRIFGGDEIGVLVAGHTGVTVRNCVIEGFYVSILVDASSGNTIQSNTSLMPDEWGIALFFSDDNVVEGNSAMSSESHGFVVWSSHNNRFVGNSGTSDGGHAGIAVTSSSGNSFMDSDIAGYTFGFTVEAGWWDEQFDGSNDNIFNGNEVTGSGIAGFLVAKADGNRFAENRVEGNPYGFALIQASSGGVPLDGHYATNNVFAENRIRNNGVGYVNTYPSVNRVTENVICHNEENIGAADTSTIFEENRFCGG